MIEREHDDRADDGDQKTPGTGCEKDRVRRRGKDQIANAAPTEQLKSPPGAAEFFLPTVALPCNSNSVFPQPVLMFAVKDECALRLPAGNRSKFRSGGAQGRRQDLKTPV